MPGRVTFLRFAVCAFVLALTVAPALTLAGATPVIDEPPRDYSRVEVAPAKTSIYVGTVAMTMPTLIRHGEAFESTYVAKVFPYFFYNEHGRLSIVFSDAMLRQLERGEPVEFKGLAVRADGAERRIEGKATPSDAQGGKIKVRVFYSKRVELIFNTTYRFPALAKMR